MPERRGEQVNENRRVTFRVTREQLIDAGPSVGVRASSCPLLTGSQSAAVALPDRDNVGQASVISVVDFTIRIFAVA